MQSVLGGSVTCPFYERHRPSSVATEMVTYNTELPVIQSACFSLTPQMGP